MRAYLLLVSFLGLSLGVTTSALAETLMAPSFKDPYKMVPIDGSKPSAGNSNGNETEEISTSSNAESPEHFPSFDESFYVPDTVSQAPTECDFALPIDPIQSDRYNYALEQSEPVRNPYYLYNDKNKKSKPQQSQQASKAPVVSSRINSQAFLEAANANTAKALQTLNLPPCENANPNAWHQCATFKYHPNGQVMLAEPFVRGELTGYVVQLSETGQLQSVTHMKANKKDGVAQGYYPNGALKNMTSYRKDFLDGTEYGFYQTGDVYSVENYKTGRKHGIYKLYYEDGQLMFEASYQNNQLVGVSNKYYPNGVMSERLSYSKGKPQGIGQQYYPDGSIKVEAPFVNGMQQGVVKHYAPEGYVQSETEYVKNQPQGNFTEYYPSGKVKRTATYRLGKLNGEAKLYHEQGWLEQEINYLNGEIMGEIRTYDHNGVLRERALYKHNKPHGLTTYYDDQGMPWREINFYYGLPHGASWLINQYGELYVRLEFVKGRLISARCSASQRLLSSAEIQALLNHNIMPHCP